MFFVLRLFMLFYCMFIIILRVDGDFPLVAFAFRIILSNLNNKKKNFGDIKMTSHENPIVSIVSPISISYLTFKGIEFVHRRPTQFCPRRSSRLLLFNLLFHCMLYFDECLCMHDKTKIKC